MRSRLAFALIALIASTAFAPAPFPRKSRGVSADGIDLASLRGEWVAVDLHMTQSRPPHRKVGSSIKEVRIHGNEWAFLGRDGKEGAKYTIAIDPRPAAPVIEFYRGGGRASPYGTGILRRKGNSLEVLYNWTDKRPGSFEDPPEGCYLLTLRRR